MPTTIYREGDPREIPSDVKVEKHAPWGRYEVYTIGNLLILDDDYKMIQHVYEGVTGKRLGVATCFRDAYHTFAVGATR